MIHFRSSKNAPVFRVPVDMEARGTVGPSCSTVILYFQDFSGLSEGDAVTWLDTGHCLSSTFLRLEHWDRT